MRRNEPVSQREFEIPDGATLMSTTDAQSHITYANDAFVAASGFSREQLQGQPHNVVRHPDMPPEAFADMWATLKAGEPWTALVKNRRQDGDHYWVRANATPVQRQGQITGYMSVRTKPSREEVAAAEALYRDMREGRARGRRLHKGLVVRGRALAQTMPARWRIRCAFGALALLLPAGAALLGVGGGVLGGLALWSLAVSALGAWWLEGQIARPLERVRDHALRVVRGDKQAELDLGRVDEIGMVLRCVGQLGLMFRWIIDDVSGQAVNVRTASQEIAAGNADLSSRTEQAAASVEQTAATMDQMTATVRRNAEAAAEASRFAAATSASAGEGGRVMGQVVATMDEISGSSRRIAEIIGTIDGIAFQTNILALNAAVEAARAGEQGRGFAVVAGEVRSLAQRSAAAAREIKGLIGASVDKVETGARLVGDAGRTMNEIVSQVGRVSGLIAEFSHATTEQSSGIAQVGQAVSHMDRITQQNAALVEQSAASSESLRQQATRLAEAVGVFR